MSFAQPRSDYVLFVDESGKSSLTDNGSNFLLSGIIINKNLDIALSRYMNSLKAKFEISTELNLHAYDLFETEKIVSRDPNLR